MDLIKIQRRSRVSNKIIGSRTRNFDRCRIAINPLKSWLANLLFKTCFFSHYSHSVIFFLHFFVRLFQVLLCCSHPEIIRGLRRLAADEPSGGYGLEIPVVRNDPNDLRVLQRCLNQRQVRQRRLLRILRPQLTQTRGDLLHRIDLQRRLVRRPDFIQHLLGHRDLRDYQDSFAVPPTHRVTIACVQQDVRIHQIPLLPVRKAHVHQLTATHTMHVARLRQTQTPLTRRTRNPHAQTPSPRNLGTPLTTAEPHDSFISAFTSHADISPPSKNPSLRL